MDVIELANREYDSAISLINSALESFLNFCDICGDDEDDDLDFAIATEGDETPKQEGEDPKDGETQKSETQPAPATSEKKKTGVKAAVKAMFAAIAEWFRKIFGKSDKAVAIVPKEAEFVDTETTLADLEKMLEYCMAADSRDEFTKRINAFDAKVTEIKKHNNELVEKNKALMDKCKSENNFIVRAWPFSMAHHEMKCYKIIDKQCEWSGEAATKIQDIIDVARMNINHGMSLDKARKGLGIKFEKLEEELARLKGEDTKSKKLDSKLDKNLDRVEKMANAKKGSGNSEEKSTEEAESEEKK